MLIFHRPQAIKDYLSSIIPSKKIGFVPTMGALHPGHLSLINHSKAENDITIASIFVNPTQFNDPNDFKKYPITIDKDLKALYQTECDIAFLPTVEDIYKEGTLQLETYELGYLETILEGHYRPGHYQGVCQVVSRLLQAIKPDKLYLGQKDYQQCLVISRLVQIMKLDTKVIIIPTMREKNGLAMSSRNMRLNTQEREQAAEIFSTLQYIKSSIQQGGLQTLKAVATGKLVQKKIRPEYVSIANRNTLREVDYWDGTEPLVALIAAYMGDVRLIDNMVL